MSAFASVTPVERRKDLGPREFIERYSDLHQPVLIEGVASRWPACSKWTLDYFAERMGERVVPVEIWEGEENDSASFLKRSRRAEMPMREYVGVCRAASGKRHYLAQYPLFVHEPALRDDVVSLEEYYDFPRIFPGGMRRALQSHPLFWAGPGGTVTTLHFDMYQNLFVQIAGRKRFTLVSPEQADALYYPDRRFGLFANFSPVDVEEPDLAKHPRVREVNALECEVGPGEMLFIPIGWWHHVRSHEPSLSMNFWWWPIARTLRYGRRQIWHAAKALLTGRAKVDI
jgi:hypothetical protein